MSGIKQHIIPKFILKNFAFCENNKKKINIYSRDRASYSDNIKEVETGDYFYTFSKGNDADPTITNLENSYSNLLAKISKLENKQRVKDERVSNFVAHLCMRTRTLRQLFYLSSDYGLQTLIDYISDPKIFDQLFLATISPKDWRYEYLVKNRKIIMVQIKSYLETFKDQSLEESIKLGHVNTLTDPDHFYSRSNRYKELNWIMVRTDSPLIIGDSVCLFEVHLSGVNRSHFKIIDDLNENVKNIFVPLSTYRLLLGTRSENLSINIDEINEMIAKCSEHHFFSQIKTSHFDNLAYFIGNNASLINYEYIQNIVNNIINEWTNA